MHARLTTISGSANSTKETRKQIGELMPKLRELPGLEGGAFLQNEAGRVVALTLFSSKDELVASREEATKQREMATKQIGATIESVEEFELIGEAGGSREGATHARVTVVDGPSERRDEGRRMITEQVIPAAKQIPGLQAGYWLADEASSRMAGVVLFSSEQALRDSRERAERLRQAAVEQLDATIISVDEFEVIGTV